MSASNPLQQVRALEVTEGGGVTVHRTIGTPALRNLDPFVLLDQIGSDNPDDYIAGFPSHPHRGFNTFTYMIDGDMEHRDSMGNTGNLGPGGAQWMKAASGVIHSEMPKQEEGLMRGFQLWINLPAANKMDPPEYQEYKGEAFPLVESDGARVRVLVGDHGETLAPIQDSITEVRYLDVALQPGARFTETVPVDHNGFVYLFEGAGELDGTPLTDKVLATLASGEFAFVAGDAGARLLWVDGKPLDEPVVQYGPFVMNTREEVEQAMRDFRDNRLVRDPAGVNPPAGAART